MHFLPMKNQNLQVTVSRNTVCELPPTIWTRGSQYIIFICKRFEYSYKCEPTMLKNYGTGFKSTFRKNGPLY